MGRFTKAISRVGARGVLILLGGVATLAASACGTYGEPACRDDRDCTDEYFGTRCDQRLQQCSRPCTSNEQCDYWKKTCDTAHGYCTFSRADSGGR